MEIPARTIDGNDVWAVREAAAPLLDAARAGAGPAFLEALTYRFVGHSRSDPGKYRPEGELEQWRTRDPLKVARLRLEAEGVADDTLAEIERSVEEELDAVQEAAIAAPFPEPDPTATEFKA
jgi:TPP-dependent pyruvate/acetoin dehydrogenase alpha subunit